MDALPIRATVIPGWRELTGWLGHPFMALAVWAVVALLVVLAAMHVDPERPGDQREMARALPFVIVGSLLATLLLALLVW